MFREEPRALPANGFADCVYCYFMIESKYSYKLEVGRRAAGH